MKLYYTKGACSLVVRIILNEIGLEASYESVDLKTKKTETGQNFLKINPKGAVPALELEGGESLTENAVILQYLADSSESTHLLPPVGDLNRYRVLEWLNYITTELHKGFAPLFNPSIKEELKVQYLIPALHSKFDYVNRYLQERQYLFGEAFTLADAYLFVMLRWAVYFKFDLKMWDNLNRYFTVLSGRTSVQISLKQEQ